MYTGKFHKVIGMRLSLLLLGAMLTLFSHQRLAAQDYTFESAGVVFSDSTQTFDVFFKVLENGIPIRLKSKDIKAFEVTDQKESEMTNYPPLYRDSFVTDTGVKDTITALLLVDLGTMNSSDADKYRQLAEQCYRLFAERPNTRLLFSTVGADVSEALTLDASSKDSLFARIASGGGSSDLYRGLFQHVRTLKKERGKKVVVLFSNGLNDSSAKNPYYQTQLPYEAGDILRLVSSLDYSFSIFPVAVGAAKDEEFLKSLTRTSPAPSDTLGDGILPKDLESIVGKTLILHSNNVIRLFPVDRVQRGRTRTIKLVWGVTGKEVTVPYKEGGSTNNPESFQEGSLVPAFFQQLLIAIGLVGGVLALFQFGVPGIERSRFRKKFVIGYKPESNITKRDPLTNEPFQVGEPVVVKCRQMCSLSSWEGIGGQCPNYPDCLDFNDPCDGAGAPTVDKKFFSMKGIFRQLNWLWFGLLGGFLGWLLFAIFKLMDFTWYYNLYTNIANQIGLAETTSGGGLANFDSMADDMVLGIAFGAGLCFALALVEERGQPRQLSWGRILLRTGLGTLVSAMVFILGFSIQYGGLVTSPLFSGLITWALFGLSIGIVLSVGSSIAFSRAVLGALIAAVIAYLAYYGLSLLTTDFGLARLIGFVLMGGILGTLLNTVVTALEDFELEYLSPSQYRGINPISKWLKAGLEITIGKEPGSYVYVKWDDEYVEPRHAKLSFFNGVVYIEPMAETLRKGYMLPVNKKTALKNGDIIQLGRSSVTKFKYVEKRKTQETPA